MIDACRVNMKEENEHIDNKSNLSKDETPLTHSEALNTKPNKNDDNTIGEEESVIRAIRDLTADEDTPQESQHTKITLASILGGDILGGKWFRKQFWYIVMVVAMVIVYVSNRYSCQQEMIQTKMLTDTLLDRRYKALTRSSQLKEKMRRSVIENSLADTTLQTANTPLFRMQVDEE